MSLVSPSRRRRAARHAATRPAPALDGRAADVAAIMADMTARLDRIEAILTVLYGPPSDGGPADADHTSEV